MANNHDGYDPTTGPPPSPDFGPQKPSAADLLTQQIQDFGQRINELAPRYFDVSQRLYDIGTGADPLFTDMQGGLFDVLRANEQSQLANVDQQFARRGADNTTALLNAQLRTQQGFGQARTQLATDLAQQRLGLLTQSLDPYGGGIQTESLPIALQIALENAQNAGKTPSSGGLTVICTEMYRRGNLPPDVFEADAAYGRRLSVDTMRGYHAWAKPLVRLAQRRAWVYELIRPLGWHWAHHMAYLMGVRQEPDWIGAVLLHTIKPACTVLGRGIRAYRKLRRRFGQGGPDHACA